MIPKRFLKIITAGDGGVGKTTLINRYVNREFIIDTKMTLGVDILNREIEVDNQANMLQLWDFGGQEQFRYMLQDYVIGAKGAIIMFDLTSFLTFRNLDEWFNIVEKGAPNIPIILIGAKADLEDKISVENDSIEGLIGKYKFFKYLKTSAKTGENVDDVFELLTREIINREV